MRGSNQECWGLDIDDGRVVFLISRDMGRTWRKMSSAPTKLLAFVDVFMSVHYSVLNNMDGIEPPPPTKEDYKKAADELRQNLKEMDEERSKGAKVVRGDNKVTVTPIT